MADFKIRSLADVLKEKAGAKKTPAQTKTQGAKKTPAQTKTQGAKDGK